MRTRSYAALMILLLATLGLAACDETMGPGVPGEQLLDFDFAAGLHDWTAGFADYPVGEEDKYQLQAGHQPLPAPLDAARKGYRLSGNNHSDDLLMFITRPVTNLQPGGFYALHHEVEFATRAPTGCAGVGGSPGESVYVKAGGAPIGPDRVVDDVDHYRLAMDVGNQAAEGEHALTLGTVAGPSTDCGNEAYSLKTLESAEPLLLQADEEGRLWLFVGVDSGFEATTTVYLTRVRARLTPVEVQTAR